MQTSHRYFPQPIAWIFTASLLLLITVYVGLPRSALAKPSDSDRDPSAWLALFQPLPESANSDSDPALSERIALGKKLFFEKRLSTAQDISCNSCHDLNTFGVDRQPTSPGHEGKRGTRNSPTVLNAALHFAQFWDGRAKNVEEQALGPVMNPIEMAMPSENLVINRLQSDSEYPQLFAAAFPDQDTPLTFINVGRAIGAFERTLLSPSRFDAFLRGDERALTPTELEGLRTFRDVGCVACHNGVTLGGQMFQKLGLIKEFPSSDMGRFEVTKNEADKYFFKVPSLRNVEKTAPYFHDGTVATLDQAIRLMGLHQLGKDLTDTQVKSIAAFLGSLTGASSGA